MRFMGLSACMSSPTPLFDQIFERPIDTLRGDPRGIGVAHGANALGNGQIRTPAPVPAAPKPTMRAQLMVQMSAAPGRDRPRAV